MKTPELEPELIEEALALYRAVEVTFKIATENCVKLRTEPIEIPDDAAYYALLQRGFSAEDILKDHLKTKTKLALSIRRRVPNWEDLMEERQNLPLRRDRIVDQQG